MLAMSNTTCDASKGSLTPTCFLAPLCLRSDSSSRLQLYGAKLPRRIPVRHARAPQRRARACASSSNGSNSDDNRPYGAGASGRAVADSTGGSRLHVVFVHPQIHWNTGNIGRTCLGLGATLHLVEPLGFSLEERQIRRAGLDYWAHVDVRVHKSWEEFANGAMREIGGSRLFFTKFGEECATRLRWPSEGNVVLVFGSEVDGFDGIRGWLEGEGKGERKVAFPMVDERFRSFNLSTTASMALWDAYKQVTLAETETGEVSAAAAANHDHDVGGLIDGGGGVVGGH